MKRAINSCPNCRAESIDYDGIKKYNCPSCGWEYYHNTATAVGGIIEYQGKVLVVARNLDPGKGLLDFPGGFVDPMESAETALKREIMEELRVELFDLNYLCSAPNIYKYKEIEYSTCDIIFLAKVNTDDFNIDKSEIASYRWLKKADLNPDEFAFVSMKEAVKIYKG